MSAITRWWESSTKKAYIINTEVHLLVIYIFRIRLMHGIMKQIKTIFLFTNWYTSELHYKLFWRQFTCPSVGELKKNFDNIKMRGLYVKKKKKIKTNPTSITSKQQHHRIITMCHRQQQQQYWRDLVTWFTSINFGSATGYSGSTSWCREHLGFSYDELFPHTSQIHITLT